ncbi:DUF4259 domain-containing protein [Mumia xiangluensis]
MGVFGNDDAADLAFEVDDAETAREVRSVLAQAIDTVLNDPTKADRGDVLVAVAAAALVALSLGTDLELAEMDVYGPQDWEPALLDADPHLVSSAREVVRLVCLPHAQQRWKRKKALWRSAAEHAEYLREVSAVRDALAEPQ